VSSRPPPNIPLQVGTAIEQDGAMSLACTRCYHVDVNCSDLDRSLAWYGETLGLTTLVRTTPAEPQPGAAFGLDLVQWDAWILQGAAGHSGLVLDLLQ
jgi:hypothetical protein